MATVYVEITDNYSRTDWDATGGTNYVIGDRVAYDDGSKEVIFVCIADNNSTTTPDANISDWIEAGSEQYPFLVSSAISATNYCNLDDTGPTTGEYSLTPDAQLSDPNFAVEAAGPQGEIILGDGEYRFTRTKGASWLHSDFNNVNIKAKNRLKAYIRGWFMQYRNCARAKDLVFVNETGQHQQLVFGAYSVNGGSVAPSQLIGCLITQETPSFQLTGAKQNLSTSYQGARPIQGLTAGSVIKDCVFDFSYIGPSYWFNLSTNCLFENNTFYTRWKDGQYNSIFAAGQSIFKNNIFYYKYLQDTLLDQNFNNSGAIFEGDSALYVENPVSTAGGSIINNEETVTVVNPSFIDADNGNFSLRPNSPLIGGISGGSSEEKWIARATLENKTYAFFDPNATGTGDGSSLANACTDLYEAEAAVDFGGYIFVADMDYTFSQGSIRLSKPVQIQALNPGKAIWRTLTTGLTLSIYPTGYHFELTVSSVTDSDTFSGTTTSGHTRTIDGFYTGMSFSTNSSVTGDEVYTITNHSFDGTTHTFTLDRAISGTFSGSILFYLENFSSEDSAIRDMVLVDFNTSVNSGGNGVGFQIYSKNNTTAASTACGSMIFERNLILQTYNINANNKAGLYIRNDHHTVVPVRYKVQGNTFALKNYPGSGGNRVYPHNLDSVAYLSISDAEKRFCSNNSYYFYSNVDSNPDYGTSFNVGSNSIWAIESEYGYTSSSHNGDTLSEGNYAYGVNNANLSANPFVNGFDGDLRLRPNSEVIGGKKAEETNVYYLQPGNSYNGDGSQKDASNMSADGDAGPFNDFKQILAAGVPYGSKIIILNGTYEWTDTLGKNSSNVYGSNWEDYTLAGYNYVAETSGQVIFDGQNHPEHVFVYKPYGGTPGSGTYMDLDTTFTGIQFNNIAAGSNDTRCQITSFSGAAGQGSCTFINCDFLNWIVPDGLHLTSWAGGGRYAGEFSSSFHWKGCTLSIAFDTSTGSLFAGEDGSLKNLQHGDWSIENCTFYIHHGITTFNGINSSNGTYSPLLRIFGPDDQSATLFKNNIVFNGTDGGAAKLGSTSLANLPKVEGNALVGFDDEPIFQDRLAEFNNIMNIDPLFVDPANSNFHLRPNSPIIGKGQ